MAEDNTEVPVWGDELKYLINTAGSEAPSWQDITHLLSWEDEGDEQSYEPSYIDQRLPSKYVLGTKASISYEKDLFRNNALDSFFQQNEGKTNLPVEILRVYSWVKSSSASAAKVLAKKSPFLLSTQLLSKPNSGEPVKATGTLDMADNGTWEEGDWDPSTSTFTPSGSNSTI